MDQPTLSLEAPQVRTDSRSETGSAVSVPPAVYVPYGLARLSAEEREHVRAILYRGAPLSDDERRSVISAFDLDREINLPSLRTLCADLSVKISDAQKQAISTEIIARGTIDVKSALRMLQGEVAEPGQRVATTVISKLRLARKRAPFGFLAEVCDLLDTTPEALAPDTADKLATAIGNGRVMRASAVEAGRKAGLTLSFVQLIEVLAIAHRRRRLSRKARLTEITPQDLERIRVALAGDFPTRVAVGEAAARVGLQLTDQLRRLASAALRETYPVYRQTMNTSTHTMLALIQARWGVDQHIIMDRALMFAMKAMVEAGSPRLGDELSDPVLRRLITTRFKLMNALPEAAEPLRRRAARKKARRE
ncbi:hypothetical protein [Paraburkholderia sp. SIMBA_054]|uniref:hypothetical protein n=1 Tax=Paraburkholderia sp. SIMBA_054 TaxID=3085795 RepID=UPI003978271E